MMTLNLARNQSSVKTLLLELVVVLSISVFILFYSLRNGGVLQFDEFYHLLSARSWLEHGTLQIADGVYTRGWLYTKTVGLFFLLFGESVHVARSVSALGGVFWALIVFLWSRMYFGRAVAWAAVFMLVFSGVFIDLSRYVRFYTWHGFFIFLGFASLMLALDYEKPKTFSPLAIPVSIFSFIVAYHLQSSTLIFLFALSVFILLWYNSFFIDLVSNNKHLIIKIIILFLLVFLIYKIFPTLHSQYTKSALWNINESKYVYHWYLKSHYPLFWSFFPLLLCFAAFFRPPHGLACAILFTVCFLLHTFAGMVNVRYLAYAMPFFYITCSAAVVYSFKQIYKKFIEAEFECFNAFIVNNNIKSYIFYFIIASTVFFAFMVNDGFKEAIGVIQGKNRVMTDGWVDYRNEFIDLASKVDTVVVTFGVAGIYYLGDIDFELSPTIMLETDTDSEFGLDKKTGKLVFSSLESLKNLINCTESGLIIVDRTRWGDVLRGTSPEINNYLINNTNKIDSISDDYFHVFIWENLQTDPSSPVCTKIKKHD